MEGGYDEGYAGGGFDDEPTARGPATTARARTPANDLDDDIPFKRRFWLYSNRLRDRTSLYVTNGVIHQLLSHL
jgi:hypothetical protein